MSGPTTRRPRLRVARALRDARALRVARARRPAGGCLALLAILLLLVSTGGVTAQTSGSAAPPPESTRDHDADGRPLGATPGNAPAKRLPPPRADAPAGDGAPGVEADGRPLGARRVPATPAPGSATAARPPAAVPDGFRLEAALAPADPTVGDRVTAVLTLTAPADRVSGEPVFPAWNERWGGAEIVAAEEPRRAEPPVAADGSASWRQRLVLTAFRPGPVRLPPRTVGVPAGDSTVTLATPEELGFEVASVLPPAAERSPDEPLEPKPETPPVVLPWATPAFLWTAGTLAALALFAFLLGRRLRTPGEARAAAPRLAPLAELEAALGEVREAPTVLAGHVTLSHALRRYLARTLGFAALEQTTTEIERQLLRRRMPSAASRCTVEVLRAADLVKFARVEADRAALEQRSDRARAAANAIERYLHPLDQQPGGAGGPGTGSATPPASSGGRSATAGHGFPPGPGGRV